MSNYYEEFELAADVQSGEAGIFYMNTLGFMSGVTSPETLRKVSEAQEQRARDKDNNEKPPKPPKRPNARIGGIALEQM